MQPIFKSSVAKFLQSRDRSGQQIFCYTRTKLKGIQENTSSSNIYESAIDQGATYLGGLIVQYMFADGAPLFLKALAQSTIKTQAFKVLKFVKLFK